MHICYNNNNTSIYRCTNEFYEHLKIFNYGRLCNDKNDEAGQTIVKT